MSSTTNDRTIGVCRLGLLALIVLLSIVLPIGLVGWSIRTAIWGKPLPRPSQERTIFQGFVRNRQFWYLAGTYVVRAKSKSVQWQIRRLDLQSGIESDAELNLASDFQVPFLINGEIFGSGANGISKLTDGKFIRIADWPRSDEKSGLYSYPFVRNNQLTMLSETPEGEFQLLHLVDTQWVPGRKLRLPPAGSKWIDDSKGGRQLTYPDASQKVKFDQSQDHVWVAMQGEQTHVFVTYSNGFAAYRTGFDFIDDDHNTASALETANATTMPGYHEFAGWEPIQPARPGDRWNAMTCDQDGVLITEWNGSGRVVRRTNAGNWVDVDGLADLKNAHRSVLVESDQSASYVLEANELWNTAVIYQLDENRIRTQHAALHGCYDQYFVRWVRCFAGILLAWILHIGVLAGGVEWMTGGRKSCEYSFGDRQVTLASTPRRALACFADLLLIGLIVVLITTMHVKLFDREVDIPNRDEFCRVMFEYDRRIYQGGLESALNLFLTPPAFSPPLRRTFQLFVERHSSLLTAGVLEFILLLGLWSCLEGRWGKTPGKWLMRIRTVRTSLRPCGIAHALVRSALVWIDIPFFTTPIPAAICMVLSPTRQRIGDRVADTLVVLEQPPSSNVFDEGAASVVLSER